MSASSRSRVSWTLAHAWHSDSDHAALDICAAELARIGVDFAGTSDASTADAMKMHGFEIIEALERRAPQVADLRAAAASQDWRARLDKRALRFMVHGDAVFGVPVNIHQSNCLWAHEPTAAAIVSENGEDPGDLDAWLRQAGRHIAKPLAIGNEPWQIGILFESLALARLGAVAYEEAFVQLRADTLGGRAMVAVLEQLGRWREHVDDELIGCPWREQLAAVNAGSAAVMVMGDWVSARPPAAVRRLHVDGFLGESIFVVDFFVPLMRTSADLTRTVAAALTRTDFQERFSAAKGSVPAVVDLPRASKQAQGRIDAPSLTFDQCCSVATKTRLLEVVADHFNHRRDAVRTAEALARLGNA